MQPKRDKTESHSATTAKGGLSYGWIAVIAGAFIVFIAGNFQYSFGVFVKPLADKFGWSRAAISGTVTTRSIVGSLTSAITGVLNDKYGPKRLILIGICLVGLGYLLTSQITSLWQLYIFLGALLGTGISLFFVPIVTNANRWLGNKSALANGIILSGFGGAQIVTPPVATYLILEYSWETSCIVLGITALVLGTIAWHFIRTPPNTMNQPLTQPIEETLKASEMTTRSEDDYTLSEAVRTPNFWTLFIIIMVVASCYQLIVVHIVAAAIDTGITPEAAAIILTFSGITNTLGRLMISGLATKIGKKTVLTLSLALQVVALFFLARATDLPAFYISAAVYGFGYGGVTPLAATLTGSFFGTRSMGSIFGIINSAYTAGGVIGPLLGGYIFDVTASYYTAFVYATIGVAVGFLLSLLLNPPRRKAITAQPPM
jgi:MFS family permease